MKPTEQILGSAFDSFALYFESFMGLDRMVNLSFIVSKSKDGEIGFHHSIKPDKAVAKRCATAGMDLIEMSETILHGMIIENRAAYIFTSAIYMMAKTKFKDKLVKVTSIAVKPVTHTEAKVIFEIKGCEALELVVNEGTVENYIRSQY